MSLFQPNKLFINIRNVISARGEFTFIIIYYDFIFIQYISLGLNSGFD